MKTPNEIRIQFIKPEEHREPGLYADDYWWNGNILEVRITKLKPFIYSLFLLVHALIEIIGVLIDGIKFEEIEKWDRKCKDEEQGDNPKAPYHVQHKFATQIEMTCVGWFGKLWTKYNQAIYESCKKCSDRRSR